MSRVGKQPITLPSGVTVTVSGTNVVVKGAKGELTQVIPDPISIEVEGSQVLVTRPDDSRTARARHGLVRALVANMVEGVTNGFKKELDIQGVGYRATAKGKDALELALGFSHSINYKAPAGVTFDVPTQTRIVVEGIDKQKVGQVAAEIREFRKPEPYKGKGVRYLGEHVVRKAGKAGK